ncbi:type IV pilin protein [Rheinheimera sp.]|uniref:Type IV pilin protein n=2 Tax=Rheinheimera marina TaxID=1774958 RepID=A0ABV9JMQ1_9GAMM
MKAQGIGLIELLVALAVLGILASVMLPAYQQDVLRSYRLEAQQELLKVAGLQELLLADQQRYTPDLTELGLAAKVITTSSGRYRISAELTEQGYQLEALAVSVQQQDLDCQRFSLTSLGQKQSAPRSNCWMH